jgi:plastocyanin
MDGKTTLVGNNRRPRGVLVCTAIDSEGVLMLRKLAAVAAVASIGAAVAVGPAQAGSTKTVAVKNNAFSPTSVSIHKGDKVTWKWTQGGVPHNVTPANGGSGSKTSSKKGFTFSKTFSKKGTFKYVCTIHSNMKVTVKVS